MPDMPKKPKTGSYYLIIAAVICTFVPRCFAQACGIYLYLHHQQPTNITAARLGNKQEVAEVVIVLRYKTYYNMLPIVQ